MRNTLQGKSSWVVTFAILILGIVWSLPVNSAENPCLIPFQGRLTDTERTPLNGVYRITFAIYDEPTGGNALWSEIHESVSVIKGQLNVLLGSQTKLDDPNGNGDTSDAIQFASPHFLGIKVGEDSNQEMVPRQQLVPAFHAASSDALIASHANGNSSAYGINRIVAFHDLQTFSNRLNFYPLCLIC